MSAYKQHNANKITLAKMINTVKHDDEKGGLTVTSY